MRNRTQSIYDINESIFYDENGVLRFSREIKKGLALPFRTRIFLSYKRLALTFFGGITLPHYIFYAYSFLFWNFLHVPPQTMILFELYYLPLHASGVFLAIIVIKKIINELNSLLDVPGVRKGEARVSLKTVMPDEQIYLKFKEKLLKSFYLKDNTERLGFLFALVIMGIWQIGDAYTRYKIYGNSIIYAIFGYYPYPYPLPPVIFLIFRIHVVAWFFLFTCGLIILFKVLKLINNIMSVETYITNIAIEKTLKPLLNFLELRKKYKETDLIRITRYSPLWTISNVFSKIFGQISFLLMYEVIVTIISLYGSYLFNLSTPPTVFTIFIYGVIVTFILISFLVFIYPLISFKKVFTQYKTYMIGIIQDLYEKKILHYLVSQHDPLVKARVANEISIIQEVMDYLNNLNEWPFTTPQFIKLSIITLASVILPYLFDFLINMYSH